MLVSIQVTASAKSMIQETWLHFGWDETSRVLLIPLSWGWIGFGRFPDYLLYWSFTSWRSTFLLPKSHTSKMVTQMGPAGVMAMPT